MRIMMEQNDTIKLLRECNSGIQMAVYSMEDVLDDVQDEKFKQILKDSIHVHKKLGDRTHLLLSEHGEETKEPNPIAKGMSWMKTNAKMMMENSDHTCADLITEGCNMGIKTLYRYLNQYQAADEKAKQLTEDIIREEENLRQNLRYYL